MIVHDEEAAFFRFYEQRLRHKIYDDGRRLDAVLSYVRPHVPGAPIDYLDIGCGVGSFLRAAELRGLNATGIDIGEYPVGKCCECGLTARVGSLTDTGFPDASFDLVTASNVVEHIPVSDDGLREVRRILRPGGIFVFIVPNGGYLKAHLRRDRHRNYHGLRARIHCTYHTRTSAMRVMRRCGFEPLRYPLIVGRRLRDPLTALEELIAFIPRNVARQLLHLTRLEKELFMIGRAR